MGKDCFYICQYIKETVTLQISERCLLSLSFIHIDSQTMNNSRLEKNPVKVKVAQCVRLFVAPWTIQSMEFSRLEYRSGQPFPSPGDLPNPGIEPHCRWILYQLSHKGSLKRTQREPYLGNKGPGLQNSSYCTQKCPKLDLWATLSPAGLTFPSDLTTLQLMIAKEHYILTE